MKHTKSVVFGQDPDALISLIPNKRPGEFTVRLNTFPRPRFIGSLSGNTFQKKIDGEKHVLHMGDRIAISSALIYHPTIKFSWIVVTIDGVKHVTSREFFAAHADSFHFRGQEPQLGLPKNLWGREKALAWQQEHERHLRIQREKAAQEQLFPDIAA